MNRIKQLDSLRGLAAITVVMGHFLNMLPATIANTAGENSYLWFNLIKYTPLHIFWSGHAAVILFFVLSGYVLSLPFHKTEEPTYFPFLVKRIFRLYLPYIASVGVAVLGNYYLSRGGIAELSSWFNNVWEMPLRQDLIWKHITFLGDYQSGKFNPVYWSLIVEMKVSLIFPFLMYAFRRINDKYLVQVSLIYVSVSGILSILDINLFILFIIGMFILGALLGKYQEIWVAKLANWTMAKKLILLGLGVLMYTYEHWINWFVNLNNPYAYNVVLVNGLTMFGCCIFIMLAMSVNQFSKCLSSKPLVFLGEISYSVYLYHCIVLFSMTYLLYGKVSVPIIWMTSLITTLLVATLANRLIEKPAAKYGKFFAGLLERK